MQYARLLLYIGYLGIPISLLLKYSRLAPLDFHILLELIFTGIVSYWLLINSRRFHHPLLRFFSAFIPACLLFVFEFLELISYYLQGESFNERFFFHVSLDTLKTGARAYKWLAIMPLALTLGLGVIDFHFSKKTGVFKNAKRLIAAWGLAVLACVFLPNAPKNFFVEYLNLRRSHLPQDAAALDTLKAELRKYHVNIDAFSAQDVQATLQPDSKNLILLYLESLESSYLDETRFPDLVPNIKRAIAQGLEFTNIREYPGTNWTIAGVMASQCEMPLTIMGNDTLYQNQALNKMVCLGDILNKAGYYQVYIGGADLGFAGKGNFYQAHGYQVSRSPGRQRTYATSV